MPTDFVIHNQGSVVGFTPKSVRASEWLEDNALAEPWQFLGPTLWIDYRMAQELVDGIVVEGFNVEA